MPNYQIIFRMKKRVYAVLLLATFLLACKPETPAMSNSIQASNSEDFDGDRAEVSVKTHLTSERKRLDEHVSNEMRKGIRDTYATCVDKGGTLEIGYCIAEEKSYQDERLNKVYQTLLNTISAEQKRDLVESQRAWLTFHQKESLLQGSLYGSDQAGNLQVGEYEVLRLSERADQLNSYLDFSK